MGKGRIRVALLAAAAVFFIASTPCLADVLLHSRMARSWLVRIEKDAALHGPARDVINELDDFIEVYPNSDVTDRALLLMGRLYAETDEHGKAIRHFDRLLRDFPNSRLRPDALYRLAYSRYYAQGATEEARRLLAEALKALESPESKEQAGEGAGPEAAEGLRADARGLLEDMEAVDSGAAIAPGKARIGVVLPLSGEYAAYGEEALRGIRLASGVFGRRHGPVGIDVLDSGPGRDSLVRALDKLTRDPNTVGLIGPLLSETAHDMGRFAQRRKVPAVVLSQVDGIPELGDYVFRCFLTPAQQARSVAGYAVGTLGLTSFAVLNPDTPYGRELARRFEKEVEALGGAVSGSLSYAPGEVDFSGEIETLFEIETLEGMRGRRHVTSFERALYPDALYIPDTYQRVGLIAPYLAYYGINDVRLLGSNGWNSPGLTELAGTHVEGAVFVDGFFTGSRRPEAAGFVRRFEKVYGYAPGELASHAYDAAMLLLHTLRQKGPLSREIVRERLAAVKNFRDGSSGSISFDEHGEAGKRLFLLTVRNGKIVEIE